MMAPRMKMVALLLSSAATLGACSGPDQSPIARSTPEGSPSGEGEPAERGITQPEGLIVQNVAQGGSRQLVATAIGDLKRERLWKRLTDHLYVVKIGSRLGRANVPEDGHLADVYLTAQIDDGVGGSLCDIMFFTTAMADDLDRWRTYNAQGLLDDPAPTRRQFWASILAHELAHCLDHGRGEPAAERWEAKALEAVRSGPD